MEIVSLNGAWALRQDKQDTTVPATVPGCVHTDLLAAGRIEDPYFRDCENDVQWISESDWTYTRTFDATSALLEEDRIVLRCEGLDTVAAVRLNGRLIGRADNMFRSWEFDVTGKLKSGTNELAITFTSPLKYVRRKNGQRLCPSRGAGARMDSSNWIRKEPCNFGWDWGPTLVTSGIWRSLSLVGFSLARIDTVSVRQVHAKKHVELDIAVAIDRLTRGAAKAAITVADGTETVGEALLPLRGKSAKGTMTIVDPKLWWPNNMGGQPLYDVTVDLLDADGELLDTRAMRIGLRTLTLERKKDKWGESFHFAVNGVPFFAKGANWIPADTFANRVSNDDYRRLLTDAVDANMNMLRVWGGGIYEQDTFYELCDELGLCVWQDFMFACAAYPANDDEFLANVAIEAEQNVLRLRHHACLALWCGNNELEQGLVRPEETARAMSWAEYGRLFDKLLPATVKRLDPDRSYWPCSPHSPQGDRHEFNNPACGDAHLWAVWHGRKPFEWYRTCEHRFCSEFGFQSFPEPKTTHGYTLPEDRNVTSPVMEHHQRSGIGNATIMTYMLDWFRMPTSFDMTLWLSQILQGLAIKYAVEHWRRLMPCSMGALYWQLNDCWPVASWASIDSVGRWKALHYAARKFFAPVLVSLVEDKKRGTVDVHVTNDMQDTFKGKVKWWLTTADGSELVADSFDVTAGALRNTKVKKLDLRDPVNVYGADDLMVWVELVAEGEVLSSNFITFARPKRLPLSDPALKARVVAGDEGTFQVTLTAQRPALWAWLGLSDADAVWSDNFFHVRPGQPVVVTAQPHETLSLTAFRKQLVIKSLTDTF